MIRGEIYEVLDVASCRSYAFGEFVVYRLKGKAGEPLVSNLHLLCELVERCDAEGCERQRAEGSPYCEVEHRPEALSFRKVRAQLLPLGIRVTLVSDGDAESGPSGESGPANEYKVNFVGGGEATAYYTDDLADALGTGKAMAKEPHPNPKAYAALKRRGETEKE
jgi:hypothetical protein